nr:hypothetical protein [Tanacetum cinerariifolium]
SSSVSSFVTSMLNPTSDAGVESIFTTASSPISPLPTPTPIMTPSTIATITTSSDAPIPPTTIPSAVLQNLPTFDSVFRFEERVKSFEVNFSEFMQINQFAEAVSNILESVNAQLEAEVLTRSSNSSRTSYAVAADLIEMELKKILIEKMEGNKSIQRSDEQRNLYKALEGPSAGLDRGSKRRREGGEPESASTPFEPATRSTSRSTTGTQSRQMSASESAFAEEPVQTTCQMDEPPHSMFETGAEDQPIVQTSHHPECLTELEYHLEEVYEATTDQLDWINPEGQQYPHNLLQPLPL